MRFLLTFLMFIAPAMTLAFDNAYSLNSEFGLNRASPEAMQKYRLGTLLMKDTVHELKGTWDFAKAGGAISTINLRSTTSNKLLLPKNAIVMGCYIDSITTPTGGGTIAISTGKGAGDLLAATTATAISGIVACAPTGSAATAIKLTADVTPTLTIATTAVTAGKINVHILYVLSE